MYRHVADPVVLETLIRAEHRATMAAADFTAIEHVLDREIDVDTLRLAGNFDAVAKGRHGAARPARSTVLRDVLVPAHGAVVDTIFIAPGASCSLVHTSFRRCGHRQRGRENVARILAASKKVPVR